MLRSSGNVISAEDPKIGCFSLGSFGSELLHPTQPLQKV
jgi:hypothetical protein